MNGVIWEQLGIDIDADFFSDQSGSSVSLNAAGDRVAIGAPGNGAGQTRIFNIDTTPDGACLLDQDTTIGSCNRRIWTRQFRIKAETNGYPVIAYSSIFRLYEWSFIPQGVQTYTLSCIQSSGYNEATGVTVLVDGVQREILFNQSIQVSEGAEVTIVASIGVVCASSLVEYLYLDSGLVSRGTTFTINGNNVIGARAYCVYT